MIDEKIEREVSEYRSEKRKAMMKGDPDFSLIPDFPEHWTEEHKDLYYDLLRIETESYKTLDRIPDSLITNTGPNFLLECQLNYYRELFLANQERHENELD